MAQNQPLIIDGIKIPVDLSPATRARMKLLSHFIIIAVFNAGLSALTLIDQNTIVNWRVVLISIASQGTLALLDALRKYYSASGDLPLSMLFQLGSNALASRVPPVAYNANEQAAADAISQQYQPQPVQNTAPPASVQVQYSQPAAPSIVASPVGANPQPSYHPSLDNVETISTLPNLTAIKARQAPQAQ